MKCVLDSSAIAIILKRLRENSIEILEGNITLDLAVYELGNILWKECTLKNIISRKEAVSKAQQIARILEIIELAKIDSAEVLRETMKLATELRLTFYDSSYLQVAKERKLPLVTEDKELREKAKMVDIKSITINELLKTR